jgi:hypothetical protein
VAQRVDDLRRRVPIVALLEPDVVRRTDAGQHGQLFAAQPRGPSPAGHGDADLFRCDEPATRPQELTPCVLRALQVRLSRARARHWASVSRSDGSGTRCAARGRGKVKPVARQHCPGVWVRRVVTRGDASRRGVLQQVMGAREAKTTALRPAHVPLGPGHPTPADVTARSRRLPAGARSTRRRAQANVLAFEKMISGGSRHVDIPGS